MSRRCKVCHAEVVPRNTDPRVKLSYRHLFAGGKCPSRLDTDTISVDIVPFEYTYDPDDENEETPYVPGLH